MRTTRTFWWVSALAIGLAVLLTIVTLCHAWVSSPNVPLVITGPPDEERRRASIARTGELLAQDAVDAAQRPS